MREVIGYDKNLLTGETVTAKKYKENQGMRGKVFVSLFDAETGKEIQKSYTENVMNDEYLKETFFKAMENATNVDKSASDLSGNPYIKRMNLTSWDKPEHKNVQLTLGTQIGYANIEESYNGTSTKQGSYNENYTKRYFKDGKIVHQYSYDFSDKAANGTFQSIFWGTEDRSLVKTYLNLHSIVNDYMKPTAMAYGIPDKFTIINLNNIWVLSKGCIADLEYYKDTLNKTFAQKFDISKPNGVSETLPIALKNSEGKFYTKSNFPNIDCFKVKEDAEGNPTFYASYGGGKQLDIYMWDKTGTMTQHHAIDLSSVVDANIEDIKGYTQIDEHAGYEAYVPCIIYHDDTKVVENIVAKFDSQTGKLIEKIVVPLAYYEGTQYASKFKHDWYIRYIRFSKDYINFLWEKDEKYKSNSSTHYYTKAGKSNPQMQIYLCNNDFPDAPTRSDSSQYTYLYVQGTNRYMRIQTGHNYFFVENRMNKEAMIHTLLPKPITKTDKQTMRITYQFEIELPKFTDDPLGLEFQSDSED